MVGSPWSTSSASAASRRLRRNSVFAQARSTDVHCDTSRTCAVLPAMSTPARLGVLVGVAAGLARAAEAAPDWRGWIAAALAREAEERRFFLWLPVAAMGGVALNLSADREPALWLPSGLLGVFLALAAVSRARPFALGLWLALAALSAGFVSMGLRTARVATPVLDHVRIVKLKGFVEEADLRPVGARLVIEVVDAGDMPRDLAPRRVRVTTRKAPNVAAGDYVALQARLLPPSRAVLPGGYDFARDAYFEGVGAVGSALGPIALAPPPGEIPWRQRFSAAVDQARNRLALRVNTIIGGDEGAIAAAMVTGKRDFLSNDAKELIREAGIFHIITISGVQMTLVAGIFFVVARRLLALSPTLALNYPIKKWAAVVAMIGLCLLRRRDRFARRHRARADHDVDRARRGSARSARAHHAQSRPGGLCDRRAGARGDPRRQLPAFFRGGRRAGCGHGGAACARRRGARSVRPERGRRAKRSPLRTHLSTSRSASSFATLCATARPPRSCPIISTI